MIFAFQQVATTRGAAGAGDLAEGIYQALVTTVGGLVVAIPALAAYAICRNRVDSLDRRSRLSVTACSDADQTASHVAYTRRLDTRGDLQTPARCRRAASSRPKPSAKDRTMSDRLRLLTAIILITLIGLPTLALTIAQPPADPPKTSELPDLPDLAFPKQRSDQDLDLRIQQNSAKRSKKAIFPKQAIQRWMTFCSCCSVREVFWRIRFWIRRPPTRILRDSRFSQPRRKHVRQNAS